MESATFGFFWFRSAHDSAYDSDFPDKLLRLRPSLRHYWQLRLIFLFRQSVTQTFFWCCIILLIFRTKLSWFIDCWSFHLFHLVRCEFNSTLSFFFQALEYLFKFIIQSRILLIRQVTVCTPLVQYAFARARFDRVSWNQHQSDPNSPVDIQWDVRICFILPARGDSHDMKWNSDRHLSRPSLAIVYSIRVFVCFRALLVNFRESQDQNNS